MSNEVEPKVDAADAVDGVAAAPDTEERADAAVKDVAVVAESETVDEQPVPEATVEDEADGTTEDEAAPEASSEPSSDVDDSTAESTAEASTIDSEATEKAPDEKKKQRKALPLDQVEPGKEYQGVVRNVQPYGAFVDIGAESDGLVHISELRDGYVEKVEDVVSVNETVTVRVKEVDAERGRISLTMRDSEAPKQKKMPLRDVNEGQEYQGVVTSIVDFGAFVDIGATTDGLVHISELSDQRVNRVEDVVSPGEEVTVRVLNVDRRRKRISLSMRPPEETDYTAFDEEEDEPTPTLIELAFARAAERAEGKEEPREKQERRDTSGDMTDIIRRTIEQHESDS